MGTDAYADAAGLVARSAAAYVSSVPTDPADDGFFGPASVTWRLSADLSSIVAGLRALLVQALHPSDLAGLGQYLSSVLPELRCTPAAADAAAFLLDPPGLDPDIAEIWQDIRDGATAAMPEWALQMYGYHTPGALTPARRAEIRQALGVLDVVFLGEPGVLEARQRIALR